jgi:hypothetical protein
MRSTFPTYAFNSLLISAVARSVSNSAPRCCGENQCLKPVAQLTKPKVLGFPEPLLPIRPFSLLDHRPIQFHLRGLPFTKRPISVRSPTALSIKITAGSSFPAGLEFKHNKAGVSLVDSRSAGTLLSKSPSYATHAGPKPTPSHG